MICYSCQSQMKLKSDYDDRGLEMEWFICPKCNAKAIIESKFKSEETIIEYVEWFIAE